MCLWARACDLYAKVRKTVEPKRQRLVFKYRVIKIPVFETLLNRFYLKMPWPVFHKTFDLGAGRGGAELWITLYSNIAW